MEKLVVAECAHCKTLQAQLDAAYGILEHNMGIANKVARNMMNERNQIIRSLRKKFSAIEIAEQVGLTRQRVHQILSEVDADSAEESHG